MTGPFAPLALALALGAPPGRAVPQPAVPQPAVPQTAATQTAATQTAVPQTEATQTAASQTAVTQTAVTRVEHFALLQSPDHPAGRSRVERSPLLADVDPFVRAVGVLRRTRVEELGAEPSLLLEAEYVFQDSGLRVVHTEERRPATEPVAVRMLWRELLGPRSRTLRAEIQHASPGRLTLVDAARGDTWSGERAIPESFSFPELWLDTFLREGAARTPRLFDPTTRAAAAHEVQARPFPGPAPLWTLQLVAEDGSRSTRVLCGGSTLAYGAGRDAPLAVRVGSDRYDVLRRRATRPEPLEEESAATAAPGAAGARRLDAPTADARSRR